MSKNETYNSDLERKKKKKECHDNNDDIITSHFKKRFHHLNNKYLSFSTFTELTL